MRRTTAPRRRCTCGAAIVAAGLLLTLAGMTAAQRTDTEPKPCAPSITPTVAQVTNELPTDALQRVAYRAVVLEEWGSLPAWKADAYKRVLRDGLTVQGRAWVTSYYPSEGFYRGKHTRSGIGVTERSAAVRSCDWRRHRGSYVWTAAYGMRIVEDSGANSNHRVARRKGADIWLDYWWPRPHNANPVTAYAFIASD